MKKDYVYIISISLFIAIGLITSLVWSFNRLSAIETTEISKMQRQRDSLISINDSLNAEVFVMKIDALRYENILDRLNELNNPDCKRQLEEILKQTE